MDVDGLEALRAVGTHGGVTGAAAALHLTPSAVSQRLAALQRTVDVPLTERVGRGLRLTAAGEAVAAAAVEVSVALERARAAADELRARPTGTVRVSAFQSAAQLLLPGLLSRTARLDGVAVECSDEDVALDEFPALTDRIDVVVAHRPDAGSPWPAGVRVVPLLREPLDLALSPAHRLAGRTSVDPRELADEAWVSVRAGFPVATVLDAVAGAEGPRVVHRINDFHVAAALVGAGHGVALLPRYTFGSAPGIRLVPLTGVRAGRRIDALLRPDRAERVVVRRVLDELVALAREIAA
ncbi:LysR family transcriptional regulator [Cellulomonas massiliensis]|uniref:LysR family transcriptional regulator n=1 Tax=Cellulomonas massiliensis TaxID=1465811 RepID=UPI0002E77761|nr:LysR family transcriptional regulator [Cellulomonas massiliensis]